MARNALFVMLLLWPAVSGADVSRPNILLAISDDQSWLHAVLLTTTFWSFPREFSSLVCRTDARC